jgi:hypothetical protein
MQIDSAVVFCLAFVILHHCLLTLWFRGISFWFCGQTSPEGELFFSLRK